MSNFVSCCKSRFVICVDNDLKGHLPPDCFNALSGTSAWQSLMDKWRRQATDNRNDREAFMRLLRPNAAKTSRVGLSPSPSGHPAASGQL